MTKATQTSGLYFTHKKLARTIENIGVYQESAANVSEAGGASEPQRLAAAWIAASIIPTLQVAAAGAELTEAEDLPRGGEVVIISEGLWRTRFGGNPAVIGRTLEVNRQTRQIVGVMPRAFRFPSATTLRFTGSSKANSPAWCARS